MKKLFLLIPFTLMSTLPLISSRCVHEETQEEKDKKLAEKYEKEYIDKQKYVFDDFEQFKMKDEYFKKSEGNEELWKDPKRPIKSYYFTETFFNSFDKWYNDFQHKFNIFKKIMKKYASREIIKYKNPNIQQDPIDLYYVKEVKFDFSRGMDSQSYYMDLGDYVFKLIFKLLNISNLNLKLSLAYPAWKEINLFNKTYYSKINITSSFNYMHLKEKQKIREIFSIPKPYYKNEHFMTYPAGEQIYQGKGDWKPRIKFESLRGLDKYSSSNELLDLRYKRSFDYGPSDIDQNYLKEYGNVNTFKFASYRFEIIEYDFEKPFDAPPSKVDKFTLSEHGD